MEQARQVEERGGLGDGQDRRMDKGEEVPRVIDVTSALVTTNIACETSSFSRTHLVQVHVASAQQHACELLVGVLHVKRVLCIPPYPLISARRGVCEEAAKEYQQRVKKEYK
eukprot:768626-Hanusia_phi.AAC.9